MSLILRRPGFHGDGKGYKKADGSQMSYQWIFFEQFVRGLHKCMGDVIKQDKALAVDILKEIFVSLDEEWNELLQTR
jgi:hypothetical protein